jgi:hypothetical protein
MKATATEFFYRDSLVRTDAAPPPWDIEVNSVKACSITDAAYAAIRRRVFYDFRTYAAQAINLMRVLLNVVRYYICVIPLGLFWTGVALALLSSGMMASEAKKIDGHAQ